MNSEDNVSWATFGLILLIIFRHYMSHTLLVLPESRTGVFTEAKLYRPHALEAHSDLGEDARVLLSGVTYTESTPYLLLVIFYTLQLINSQTTCYNMPQLMSVLHFHQADELGGNS